MRILVLAPYPPYPPQSGGALRIYNLLRGLSERHEVWCLTFTASDEEQIGLEPLRTFCRVVTVRGLLPRTLARRAWTTLTSPWPDMALRNAAPAYSMALKALLQAQRFDVVQAASIEMGGYGLEARNAPGQPRLVLDEFNAEYVLQRRAALTDLRRAVTGRRPQALIAGSYSLVQWQKLREYERRLLRRYDHVLAVSREDRSALQRLVPNAPISVVPNGVDTDYFNRAAVSPGIRDSIAQLVFIGTLNFRPNIDAVTWFAHEVLPRVRQQRPNARFVVVGKSPTPAIMALHDGERICIHRDVPDVRPFIAGAATYVVPMRMGGGVRLKFLEALSMQAAVVATTMGAEGIEGGADGEHFLLADDAAAFAQQVVRVIDNPTLADQLGAAGQRLAHERYDWRVIVPTLERIYRSSEHAIKGDGQ